MPDPAQIHAALDRVVDPCSIATGAPLSLAEMGLLRAVEIEGGRIHVALRLTSPICWQAANIIAKVEEVLGAVPGVTEVTCALSPVQDWTPDMVSPAAQARLRRLRPLAAL